MNSAIELMADKGFGRVFIVRPFGSKKNNKGELINFDEVEATLIEPAIKKLGMSGGTTGEFLHQGNIRVDMFRELLTADLVVADISVHNANVFYELGIRHALKDRYTVMIKANKYTDKHIFDLGSDRYLSYDPDNPAACVEKLIKTILTTLENDNSDSPIFSLLPGLGSVDPDKVVVVPLKFREKVDQCMEDNEKLEKLCKKVSGKSWEKEGLRLIGNAQFKNGDHECSSKTWELVRRFDKFDVEANQRLATNYQKLNEYKLSQQAAERAILNIGDWDQAETLALVASNYKTQWKVSWENENELSKRQRGALTSINLDKAYESYAMGFERHRSHYYSGLNAVAMLSTQLELAKLHPDIWTLRHDNEKKAEFALEERLDFLSKLAAATELAIKSSIKNYQNDQWARTSFADFLLLTSDRPEKVKFEYQRCIDEISGFNGESMKSQLELYDMLGLFLDNVQAALEVIIESEV